MGLRKPCQFYLPVGTLFGGVLVYVGCDYGYIVPMFRQTFHQRISKAVVTTHRYWKHAQNFGTF